ncbi:MAG: chromosomal replication initiator protein DnaA [Clostridia bacterium]|nr:chromosomal replication initiator protein DnaA [Clostridia bacterium]
MTFDAQVKFRLVKERMQSEVTAITFDLWVDGLELAEYDATAENKILYIVAQNLTAKMQVTLPHVFEKLKKCVEYEFLEGSIVQILTPEEYDDRKRQLELAEQEQKQQNEYNEPQKESKFNPKYTFSNFIVGKSNQFVAAAAKSVAETPAVRFNPLFIYGGVGLGKTHLLHAIGNRLHESRPDLNCIYVTCEKFTNDYISALRMGKDNAQFQFREKYRNVDVLLVDDIQFMSNKMGIQEEFFHTFNDLYQNNKQIVIASDRPPKDLPALEERLRSRFGSGLIQDIQVPDYETRMAILTKKAILEGYSLDNEVIEFIANRLDTNVREMEGMLSKVVFYASLLGKSRATMEDVQDALKDEGEVKKEDISADLIIDTVCDFYKVSRIDVLGKKKTKEIVEPRQIAIYLITETMNIPLTAIGTIFGGKDHTTIMHARDKVSSMVKSNAHLKMQINDIKARILKN